MSWITRDRIAVVILLVAGLITGLGPSHDPQLAAFWVALALATAALGFVRRREPQPASGEIETADSHNQRPTTTHRSRAA